ncbi:MAG TPA: VanW family protein, partial [Nitrososphaera sp.]|nr:VanW family protein [Nitrososphaera sp.]
PRGSRQGFDSVVAEARSDLWKLEDPSEAYLQFGKVQNLRCAIRRMNGVIMPADGVFSFWKQIGRTTTRKGYTMGRELREGCLVPSLGGGLCQLSNTLYDAVLKAGFQIVERHRPFADYSGFSGGRGA